MNYKVIKGHGDARKLDWPTLNIPQSSLNYPPGFYMANTELGEAILIVRKGFDGECHIIGRNDIPSVNEIEISNVTKLDFDNLCPFCIGVYN